MARGGKVSSGHSRSSYSSNSGRKNSSSSPRVHSSTSHSSSAVTVTCSNTDPDFSDTPAVEIDRAREAAYNALGDLVTLTTRSRDSFSDRITEINNSVVTALADYVDNSPLVSAVSDDLSVWLNKDSSSKVDDYNDAIRECESAKDMV